ADETINYKKTPDWDKEVLRLTDGIGVDHVVEVGGAGTLSKSVNAARIDGHVSVIGVLASGSGFDPIRVVMKSLRLRGIFVGSLRVKTVLVLETPNPRGEAWRRLASGRLTRRSRIAI